MTTKCRCKDEALYGRCWCKEEDPHEPDCDCRACTYAAELIWADAIDDEMRDNRYFGEEVQ
jgi:hypothetical protein